MILPPSFSIRKTGNLYQLRHKDLGTVFQSHDRKECERYAYNPPSAVLTMELCRTTDAITNASILANSEN